MRRKSLGAMCAASLFVAACGADEEEAPIVPTGSEPAEVVVEVPTVAPAHGGTVVAAGDQQVEVVPQEDGTVNAYVVTAEPPPPEQTRLTVRVPADDGHTHPVVLTWDPSAQRYRGRLRRVRPVAGPVEVVMVVDGQRYQGSAPEVIVVAPSAPSVQVVAAQPARPEVVVAAPARPTVVVEAPARPTVVVEAPRPTVVVEAPRPTIVVEPPRPGVVVVSPPRPGVVVVEPRPRTVVVRESGPRVRVHHDNGLHLGHGRGHGHGRH